MNTFTEVPAQISSTSVFRPLTYLKAWMHLPKYRYKSLLLRYPTCSHTRKQDWFTEVQQKSLYFGIPPALLPLKQVWFTEVPPKSPSTSVFRPRTYMKARLHLPKYSKNLSLLRYPVCPTPQKARSIYRSTTQTSFYFGIPPAHTPKSKIDLPTPH